MKVLHFYKTYWPDTFGGIERTIHAICQGVRIHGIESDVLSLSSRSETCSVPVDDHFAHTAKLDFEFASTGFSRTAFHRFGQLSSTADLVHFHFPWPLMDIVHFTTKHKKPSVVTYHSDIVKQKLLLRLYEPLMLRFLGGMDRIVATSPNYLKSSPVLQMFRSKVDIIPIGLNEKAYPPLETNRQEAWRAKLPKDFFLFVGVFRYYKGIHTLMDAAEKSGIDVVFIGHGKSGSFPLEAQRRNIKNLHFLGNLSDEDKMAILDLSIGLILPSHLRSEAFGLSLVEAAMRGKPMISCEIGTGTSYVNLGDTTGLVIPPNDPNALVTAMRRLLDDKALAEEYGRNARQRYEENFTAQIMADSYAELYRRILTSRPSE